MSAQHEWTEEDDRFLIFYGPMVGYDFVASHDLGLPAAEGEQRIVWLRENRRELVAEVEREAGHV